MAVLKVAGLMDDCDCSGCSCHGEDDCCCTCECPVRRRQAAHAVGALLGPFIACIYDRIYPREYIVAHVISSSTPCVKEE
jgi:hypothetical protein